MFRLLTRTVKFESDFDKSDLSLELPACLCPGTCSGCFGPSPLCGDPPSVPSKYKIRYGIAGLGFGSGPRWARTPQRLCYVMPTVLWHTLVLDYLENFGFGLCLLIPLYYLEFICFVLKLVAIEGCRDLHSSRERKKKAPVVPNR